MNTQPLQTRIEELEDLVNYCPIPAILRSKLVLEIVKLRFHLTNNTQG